jgi:hypothetical protein
MKVLQFSVLLLLAACAAEPATEVTISTLDFGVVSEAGDYTGELRVTNVGETSAQVARILQRGGVLVTTRDVHLEPGESTVWPARLEVRKPGLTEVEVTAVFNGSETRFPVRAFLGAPCEPVTIDVGDRRVGTSTASSFQVQNPFSFPAELDLGFTQSPFTVEPAGKLRLAAGETRSVTVTYAPTSPGLTEASWTVASRTDCIASASTLRGRALDRALTLVPGRLDFGEVPVGTLVGRTAELRNATSRPIRVFDARLAPGDFSFESEVPFEVPARSAVTLRLNVRATSSSETFSELVLMTDFAAEPTVTLPLLRNRTTPCVTASRTQVDFSTTEASCRSERERIELANGCAHAVSLSLEAQPQEFTLVRGADRVSIEPGARVPFEVLFTPASAGLKSRRFRFNVDVLDGLESLEIGVSGEGTPAVPIEEQAFVPFPKLDMLVVLDDGPQMLPFAESFSTGLAQYISNSAQFDRRLAIVTTSTEPGELGRPRLSNGAEWLSNPPPELARSLGAITGAQSGRSSCLEVFWSLFSEPASVARRMLRPDASLVIICATNRPDEIALAPMETITKLEAVLPRSSVVNLLGPIRQTEDGWELDDSRWMSWVEVRVLGRRSVQLYDVASPLWPERLYPTQSHLGAPSWHVLSRRPDFTRGPLRAWVRGSERFQPDWEWLEEHNAVRFDPPRGPWFGDRLLIRYLPECPR